MRKLVWRLVSIHDVETRYCPNCGKVVEFKKSEKTRSNSNGKNTYHFEIYKCPNDHTWNKKTKTLPSALHGVERVQTKTDRLIWNSHDKKESILIILEWVIGKWRLDKLLSDNIEGLSRKRIAELIKRGEILVSNQPVKSNYRLKKGDEILIMTDNENCLDKGYKTVL